MPNSGGQNVPSGGGGGHVLPPPDLSTTTTDILPGLTSSVNLSEEVKMSIRSISSEITIFEIKTPMPERSVPPCTAGSTTITTIGPVTTPSSHSHSGSQQHSLSVRQTGGVIGGAGGASLFSLNNKQIQLQPISGPLSRSQQMAAQSRGLSITASSSKQQGPSTPPSIPTSKVEIIGMNQQRRVHPSNLSSSILLNQHHKVTLAPVRSSNIVVSKLHMRNNSNLIKDFGHHSSSPPNHHGHHQQGSSGIDDRRFDPLMLPETRMVDEEQELNCVIDTGSQKKSPVVNNTLQLQKHHLHLKRAPVNRFTQFQQLQKLTSHSSQSPKMLAYPQQQQNRRKPVLIQLVELPDEDAQQRQSDLNKSNDDGDVISTKLVASLILSGERTLTKPGNLISEGSAVKQQLGMTSSRPTAGRGRVSSRRRKRKRIFSTNKLQGSNIPRASDKSVNKPSKMITTITTPVAPPPITTTMYRTRTVVKLAAENKKALEAQTQNKQNETSKLKSIVGRPGKRHHGRKLSTTEQLSKKDRYVDLESSRSVLTQINPLHKLLTMSTFSTLPEMCQYQLLQLLPAVDREIGDKDGSIRLRDSALSNEFFKKACQQWRQMLSDGEFMPIQRYQNRIEAEKDKSKLDPWKIKNFEPIWGQKTLSSSDRRNTDGIASVENSLVVPKQPSVYNLRRSPLRSPPCSTSSVDSSPLMDIGQQKENQIKSEEMEIFSKFEMEELSDDDDDDDENDADFDANDETCSEEGEEEMSSARTTGLLVQKSPSVPVPMVVNSFSEGRNSLNTTRSRKRSGSGIHEDQGVQLDEKKKIKVVPPKLSPIEEVQNKLGDVSIKLVPSPKLSPEDKQGIKQSNEVNDKTGFSDLNRTSDSSKSSSPSSSAQLQVSPECDKEVHIALGDKTGGFDGKMKAVETIPFDMPSIIENAPADLKITENKGSQFLQVVPTTSLSVTITTTTPLTTTIGGTRRLRSIVSNAPKKDVAIEVNMPEMKTTLTLPNREVPTSGSSHVSVPVGTGATLTLIPMSSSENKQAADQKRDLKPVLLVNECKESSSNNCLIPPEIQCILPATLTVVPSEVSHRLMPQSSLNKITRSSPALARSSPTLTLVASPHPLEGNKIGAMTLSGGDVTIIPNNVETMVTYASENENSAKGMPGVAISVEEIRLDRKLNSSLSKAGTSVVGVGLKEMKNIKTEGNKVENAGTYLTSETFSKSGKVAATLSTTSKKEPEESTSSTENTPTKSEKKEKVEVVDVKKLPNTPLPAALSGKIQATESSSTSLEVSKPEETKPQVLPTVSSKPPLPTTTNSSSIPLAPSSTAQPVSQIPVISTQVIRTTSPVITGTAQVTSQAKNSTCNIFASTTIAPTFPPRTSHQQTVITISSFDITKPAATATSLNSSPTSTTTASLSALITTPLVAPSSHQILDSSSPSSQESGNNKSLKSRPKSNKVTIEVNVSSPSTNFPSTSTPPPSTCTTTATTTKQASSVEPSSKVPRPISTSHPPGQINLERSYQICRAVIQNSPNRDQLQHQLVKPPPVPTRLQFQQQQQAQQFRMIQQQGQCLTQVVGEGGGQMIQVQRRSSTPTLLTTGGTTLPIQLSGVGPHQKVILAQFANPQQSPGQRGSVTAVGQQITIGQTPGQMQYQQQPSGGQTTTVVPALIRPTVQPGSPIIMRATATGQNPQFVPQQSSSTTVITPQQLALLIQQQQHQQPAQPLPPSHRLSPSALQLPATTYINLNQLNRPLSQPNRPSSASNVLITNPNPTSSTISINPNPPTMMAMAPNGTTHKLVTTGGDPQQFLRQTTFSPSPQQPSSVRHQVLHIQKPGFNNNSSSPNSSTNNKNNYPLRAKIVTSKGETITIHRAATPPMGNNSNNNVGCGGNNNSSSRVVRPVGYGDNNNRSGCPQNKRVIAISGSRVPSPNTNVGIPVSSNSSSGHNIQLVSSRPVLNKGQLGQIISGQKIGGHQQQHSIRLISVEQASSSDVVMSGGRGGTVVEHVEGTTTTSSLNSISNLAEFITNQLAASNMRSISPLTLDQSTAVKLPTSNKNERCSPIVQHQNSSGVNNGSTESGLVILSSLSHNSTMSANSNAVNSNVISSSSSGSSNSNKTNSFGGGTTGIPEFINCTAADIIMDFHDVLSSDSPYSLISDADSQAITEVIDLPSALETIVVTSSASPFLMGGSGSGQYIRQGGASELVVMSQAGNHFSLKHISSSPNNPIFSSQSSNQNPNQHHHQGGNNNLTISSSSSSPLLLTSSNNNTNNRNLVHRVITTSSTTSSSHNHLIVSSGGGGGVIEGNNSTSQGDLGVGINTAAGGNRLQPSSNNGVSMLPSQGGGGGNSSGILEASGSGGIRQQQYIIVQTTGSNGMPTNLAVPASIVISPQGQLILNNNDQNGSCGNKGPPRASSAPPPGNQIIINAAHQQNMSVVEGGGSNNIQQHRVISVTSANGGGIPSNNTSSLGNKTMTIPTLEIQEGGAVRVVYSGQSSIQHAATVNNNQLQQQRSYTLTQNRTSQISSTTTQGQFHLGIDHSTTSRPHQQINSSTASLQGPTLSFPANINLNSLNLTTNQNIVQVSQSPTIVHHQQTINQLLNVTELSSSSRQISSSTWNNISSNSSNSSGLINVNLNGIAPGSTARIITTTQPGQHPVISIPDTTQGGISLEVGGDASGLLEGQEFDIFRAIEGMNAKMSGGSSSSCNNGVVTTNNVINMNSNGSVSVGSNAGIANSSEFNGVVEEVGQIILDSGGNCVCDLRAMIMCPKCCAFYHDDCMPLHADCI